MAYKKIKIRLNSVMEKLGLGLTDPDIKANPKPIARQNYDDAKGMTVAKTPFVNSRLEEGDLIEVKSTNGKGKNNK